jgi:hypothetical protein
MLTRERVRAWLERRFFLRIHMTLILGATFFAGIAATKGLLLAGVHQLMLRYGLAVLAAYLVFLFLIRLWLMYVRIGGIDFDGSGVNTSFNIARDSGSSGPSPGGGRFGGGGASGSWSSSSSSSSTGGGGKSFFGGKLDFDFDGDDLVVVVAFIALVLALLLAGVYIVYSAPAIFSEALFEALLAGALVRQTKNVTGGGWVGAVWRATFWPFAGILAVALFLGWAVHHVCPSAMRLGDVFHCVEER